MIRESLVDTSLNRLSSVFGSRLIVRPPATAEETAQLEQLVGPLPREFAIFLLTCNGLRFRPAASQRAADWILWHSHDIVASIVHPNGQGTPPGLLPFCGNPTGVRDCLVPGHGPVGGAVVRWDPLNREVELLSSGFGRYFERWCEYMVARHASRGGVALAIDAPVFDASFIAASDPEVLSMRESESVRAWLHQLDHIVAGGDDYE